MYALCIAYIKNHLVTTSTYTQIVRLRHTIQLYLLYTHTHKPFTLGSNQLSQCCTDLSVVHTFILLFFRRRRNCRCTHHLRSIFLYIYFFVINFSCSLFSYGSNKVNFELDVQTGMNKKRKEEE